MSPAGNRDRGANGRPCQEADLAAEPAFRNLLAVLRYLQGTGWHATKTTLYRHAAEGRLKPGHGGLYAQTAVDRYARRYLDRVNGPRAAFDPGEDPDQAAKAAADVRLRTAQAEIHEEKLRILRGAYILRADVERALSARAAIFVADTTQRDRRTAAEISSRYNLGPDAELEIIELLRASRTSMFQRYSEALSLSVPAAPVPSGPPETEDPAL